MQLRSIVTELFTVLAIATSTPSPGQEPGTMDQPDATLMIDPTLRYSILNQDASFTIRAALQAVDDKTQTVETYTVPGPLFGVEFEELSDVLRSQLNVQAGLVVTGFAKSNTALWSRALTIGRPQQFTGKFVPGPYEDWLDDILKPFDVLVSANDQALRNVDDLLALLVKTGRRKDVALQILRDGNRLVQTVRAEDLVMPASRSALFDPVARAEEQYQIGVSTDEVDELTRTLLKLRKNRGVLIAKVLPNSVAEQARLQPNDIVLMAANQPISSGQELAKTIQESAGKPITLDLIRAGKPQSVTVAATPQKRFDIITVGVSQQVTSGFVVADPVTIDAHNVFPLQAQNNLSLFTQPAVQAQLEAIRQTLESLNRSIQNLERRLALPTDSPPSEPAEPAAAQPTEPD